MNLSSPVNLLAAASKRRNEPKPPLELSQLRKGAPCSRQRTWVWQAGRSPSSSFFWVRTHAKWTNRICFFLRPDRSEAKRPAVQPNPSRTRTETQLSASHPEKLRLNCSGHSGQVPQGHLNLSA